MPIRLASRNKSPVNGFRFRQLETKWKSWEQDPSTLWSFSTLCTVLRNHRLSNPQFKLETDMGKIMEEVDRANATRMKTIPGAEEYYIEEGGAAIATPKALRPHPNVVAKSDMISAGAKLLSEWKKEGYGTVSQEEANRRADICAVCPKNGDGGFEKFFTIPLSKLITSQVEGFRKMELVTTSDDKLKTCTACLCPLKLKVWCQMPLILKHLQPEAKADLDSACWITESERVDNT